MSAGVNAADVSRLSLVRAGHTPTAASVSARVAPIELVLAFLLLQLRFLITVPMVEFHPDESQWIATSTALEAFLGGNADAPVWQESYWTLTHPPVARYVIGIGRRVMGYRPSDLNRPWHWGSDAATNLRNGAMPDAGLLWAARVPMTVLAAAGGTIGMFLLVQLAGRPAGYGWLILFGANPFFARMLTRATSEAPLFVGVMVIALLSWRVLTRVDGRTDRAGLLRLGAPLVLLGVACGLTGAAKLTGLAALPLVVAIAAWAAWRLHRDGKLAASYGVASVLLLPAATLISFIAVNPYLYPAPFARTESMVKHRLAEVRVQAIRFPDQRIPSGLGRLRLVGARLFDDYVPLRLHDGGIANGAFCLIGLLVTVRAAQNRSSSPGVRAAALVLLAFATVNAVALVVSPFDWDRYFMLPVVFGQMFCTIGIATLLERLALLGARRPTVGAARST